MPTSKTSLLTNILATGLDPWTRGAKLVSPRDTASLAQASAREVPHDDAAIEDVRIGKSASENTEGAADDSAADAAADAASVESGVGVPAPADIVTVTTGFGPLSALDEAPVFTPPPGGMQTMTNNGLIAEQWLGSDALQPLGNGGLIVGYWDEPLLPLSISLVGTEGDDQLHGGEGDDTILDHANGLYWVYDTDSLYGHGGNDLIIAGLGDDLLDGGDGNDELYGGFGDDSLIGGDGFDRLYGGGSNDVLEAGAGSASVMYGEDGNDSIFGGDGYDWVRGGSHNDYIDGGAGNDLLWGDDADSAAPVHGDDTILGGEGNDSLYGQGGDDVLEGGNGRDHLEGWTGDDILLGGAGNDFLVGGSLIGHADGSDVLDGGAGDDVLLGNTGSNVMTGGSGADIFLCDFKPLSGGAFDMPDSFGHNTVTDFDEDDKVQGFSAAQVGSATHVYSDTGQLLFVLLGHDVSDGIALVW